MAKGQTVEQGRYVLCKVAVYSTLVYTFSVRSLLQQVDVKNGNLVCIEGHVYHIRSLDTLIVIDLDNSVLITIVSRLCRQNVLVRILETEV